MEVQLDGDALWSCNDEGQVAAAAAAATAAAYGYDCKGLVAADTLIMAVSAQFKA